MRSPSWIVPILLSWLLTACGNDSPSGPGDGSGDPVIWTRTFGGVFHDEAWGIEIAGGGGVFVATHQSVGGFNTDAFVYRLDFAGNVLWENRWGGPYLEQVFIARESDGVLYVGGRSQTGLDLATSDALLLAFDAANGDLLWSFTWDGAGDYEEVDGIVIESGAIYLSGWIHGDSSSFDLLLLQVSLDGQFEHFGIWGSAGWDEANGHMVAAAGRLYVAGRYDAELSGLGGDALLAAFDPGSFAPILTVTDGQPGLGVEDALGLATDGFHLYMVGIAPVPGLASQIQLWAFDLGGNLQWKTDWGGPGAESARAIAVDPADGTLVVAGRTASYGAGRDDLILLRFESTGVLLDTLLWGGSGLDAAHDLVMEPGSIFVAGETGSLGAGSQDGLALVVESRAWSAPTSRFLVQPSVPRRLDSLRLIPESQIRHQGPAHYDRHRAWVDSGPESRPLSPVPLFH